MAMEVLKSPGTAVARPFKALKLLVLAPDVFFERKAEEHGLKQETLLLLVAGLVGTVLLVFVVESILGNFRGGSFAFAQQGDDPIIGQRVTRQLWGRAGHPAVGILILWALYTIVLYLVSWLFDGVGTISKTAKLTAWGLAPMVLANLVHYGSWALALTQTEISTQIQGGRPPQKVAFLLNEVRAEPIAIAGTIVGLLALIWCAYLLTFAMKHARDLSRSDAMKVAAIPVAVHGGYLIWQLLNHTVLSPF
ncbi:Yip1 family protein [Halosimplex pelagicum]|uniref:YIP1 family protein n=1 Tax=Halosimplex pelagicum TaxID=869886 RepID=A0A7D5PB51_9EURY|nr:YIP1 family protein [Halosimplex pelagicum]QLH82002.1 YIP1 family protein [Halosimplex pelagicum]